MTRVSSLSSAPVSVLGPSASPATIKARLVRLFDPGTFTRARGGGPVQGVIVISAGYARGSLISIATQCGVTGPSRAGEQEPSDSLLFTGPHKRGTGSESSRCLSLFCEAASGGWL